MSLIKCTQAFQDYLKNSQPKYPYYLEDDQPFYNSPFEDTQAIDQE